MPQVGQRKTLTDFLLDAMNATSIGAAVSHGLPAYLLVSRDESLRSLYFLTIRTTPLAHTSGTM